jgi:hypothetical protein
VTRAAVNNVFADPNATRLVRLKLSEGQRYGVSACSVAARIIFYHREAGPNQLWRTEAAFDARAICLQRSRMVLGTELRHDERTSTFRRVAQEF